MAYGKKKAYGRRYRKRRGNYGARVGAKIGSVAYKAFKMAKQIKDVINVEYHENIVSGTLVPDYNGVQTILNTIAQGDGIGQRTGDSIKNQLLELEYIARFNGGGAAAQFCRVIVVWWKTIPNYSINTAANLLAFTTSDLAVISPKLEQYKYDSKILYDRCHELSANDPAAKVKKLIPINQHTKYGPGSTTITSGQLQMFVITDTVVATGPSFRYMSHLSFTDN